MWDLAAKIFLSLNLLTLPVNYLPTITLVKAEQNPQIILTSQSYPEKILPKKINNDSWGVKITAVSAAVIDEDTGAVLWQKNAQEVRSIASITKLMTALVFLDSQPDWERIIVMSPTDEANGDTPEILRGEEVKLKDVFYTALIASDNNAAKAIIRSTSLTDEEFVDLMNKKAKALGLVNTHFVDVTGLEVGNQSTALEILQLAKIAFSNSDLKNAVKLAEYNFTSLHGKNHKVVSTNRLFNSYLQVTAGKTGFINQAGYCLVSEITNQAGQKIIAVVLGSRSHDDRFQDLKILATWILNNFRWS